MRRPRLGFLGVGWIGRDRMQALLAAGGEAAAICDPDAGNLASASALAPAAPHLSFEEMLATPLDGIVIATPSALHAGQAIEALKRGTAVFCQKPLGRDLEEVRAVLEAARRADRLIGVDLSYRYTAAMQAIHGLIDAGSLGRIFAVDLVFHNAYGPDKDWFYDPARSGGGCLMDLGVHLIDLALWVLGRPRVLGASATLLRAGRPIRDRSSEVEDFALAELQVEGGVPVRVACSWRLPAGRDAVISAAFYGTEGGAAMTNIDGSFYDFTAQRFHGTTAEMLTAPPDVWGGRAAVDWMTKLTVNPAYDQQADRLAELAAVIDRIYAAAPAGLS